MLAQRPRLDLVEEILEPPLEAVLNAIAGVCLVAPAAPAPEQPIRLVRRSALGVPPRASHESGLERRRRVLASAIDLILATGAYSAAEELAAALSHGS